MDVELKQDSSGYQEIEIKYNYFNFPIIFGKIADALYGNIRIIFWSMAINETDVSITVTVLREDGTDGDVGISYYTVDNSAIAGIQYTATTGSLSWADGDSSNKTFEVPIANLNSTGSTDFKVYLENPTGGSLIGSVPYTTVTIIGTVTADNGSIRLIYPTLGIYENQVSLTVTVLREGGSSGSVGVSYGTSDGTATAGIQYTTTTGSLSWSDGDTANKTFEVPVSNLNSTGSTDFKITLSSPTGNAILAYPTSSVATIIGIGGSPNTVYAASPSYTDVSNAIAAASDGDTISIPAGSATWDSTLVVTKWLSFVGAGIDLTTITVNVNNASSGNPDNCGLRLQGGGYNQVTGITWDGNTLIAWPAITCYGGTIRIHHCKFVRCRTGIQVTGPFGVIDHNEFENNHNCVRVCGFGIGKINWDNYYPISFDSLNYLFIEDNHMVMDNTMPQNIGDYHVLASSGQGSSYVVRHNSITSSYNTYGPCFDWHGDNNDGTRGNLSTQIYENNWLLTSTAGIDKFCDARGGQALIYNNTVTCTPGYGGRGIIVSEEYPSGTTVAGETVFDKVEVTYEWNNKINGVDMNISCDLYTSPAGCSSLGYYAETYTGSFSQTYPHPLVI